MKIFGLFAKPAMRHVRQPQEPAASADALATSRKIDAIESEISAEFGQTSLLPASQEVSIDNQPTPAQCMDEAALLFANAQPGEARQLLLQATTLDGSKETCQQAWWMLFDLALTENQPELFEQLALDYAQAFETSPPQWQARTEAATANEVTLPVVTFRGKLWAGSLPALQQLQKIGLKHNRFHLEFGTIAEVDLEGCEALLNVLQHWQQAGCVIAISGGNLLVAAIRPLLQTGRRDSNDAGWCLLIRLLHLMNLVQDYETACVNYCITYEVSPPASPPPAVATLNESLPVFLMPPSVILPVDKLLLQIERYAAQSSRLILDCSRLGRVEFNAAVPWLNGVRELAAGKAVECRSTGFLVGRLLQLVGGGSLLKIIYRKP